MALTVPSDARRLFFFNAQKGVCHLRRAFACYSEDGRMDYGKNTRNPRRASWDHILPRSSGGKDEANLLLACYECNQHRGYYAAPKGAAERAVELWAQWVEHCAATHQPPEKPKPTREKPNQPFVLNERGIRVWPPSRASQ